MGRVNSDISGVHDATAVVASDSTVIPGTRGLYVAVTGNVAVRHVGGSTVTYTNVPVGIIPLQVDKVLSTGTTATGIIALR